MNGQGRDYRPSLSSLRPLFLAFVTSETRTPPVPPLVSI